MLVTDQCLGVICMHFVPTLYIGISGGTEKAVGRCRLLRSFTGASAASGGNETLKMWVAVQVLMSFSLPCSGI